MRFQRLWILFWHTHILFTREYKNFCSEIFGLYIRHAPLDEEDAQMVAHVRKLYQHTLTTYKELFNDVDNDWWPQEGQGGYQLVCLHMLLTNEEILANAVFDERPDLMAGVTQYPEEVPARGQ